MQDSILTPAELHKCMESQSQMQTVWDQRFQEQSVQAQNNQKILQELIFRMSKQLEDQHQVMASMSRDINEMQTRQIRLESKVDTKRDDSKMSSLSKRIQKRRDLECRTIIPWDEVDLDMYSEL